MKNNQVLRQMLCFSLLLFAILGDAGSIPAHAAPRLQSDVEHQLQIGLESPNTPVALMPGGDPILFEITVRNTGATTATNVIVEAEHDVGYLVVDLDSQAYPDDADEAATSTSLDEAGRLRWQISQLLPEEEWVVRYQAVPLATFKFALLGDLNERDAEYAGTTSVANRASARIGNQEAVQATTAFEVRLPWDGLDVSKIPRPIGDNPARSAAVVGADGAAEFTLTISNNTLGFTFRDLLILDLFTGDADVPRVESVDVLGTEPPTTSADFFKQEAAVEWRVAELRPGESWSVIYRATVAPGGNREIANRTFVKVGEQPYGEHDHDSLRVQIPQLSLTQQVEPIGDTAAYAPGARIQTVLYYANDGTGDATNVQISQRFDPLLFDNLVESVATTPDASEVSEGTITWSIESIRAGERGELRLELLLRPGLLTGESLLTSQASLAADNHPLVNAAESTLTIHSPQLRIEIAPQDLNGDKIAPGDKLLVRVRLENVGKIAASDVELSAAIAEQLGALVDNISDDGLVDAETGTVQWRLGELDVGGVQAVSYELQLPGDINEVTSVDGKVAASTAGGEATASTAFAVEPQAAPAASAAEANVPSLQQNFPIIALLVGGLIMGAFFLVGFYARYLMLEEQLEARFREVVEMFTIVIIVAAVLLLAMVSSLGSNAAVSVLSGIAGYVLGRGSGR